MRNGRTLQELAVEVERQRNTKRDFIADTRVMSLANDQEHGTVLSLENQGRFAVNEIAHSQLAQRLGIPQKYYDRLRTEAPELLVHDVNHWLHAAPEKRMIRTIDGRMRAFLSDRYRPLDNYDLLEAVLPQITTQDLRIESCEVTESRLYLKIVSPRIQMEVKRGDVVQAGLVVSNSEIGCGALKVEPMIYRLVCLNGLISADHSMKKYHVGRGFGEDDATYELLRDETRMADDRAFFLKVRDIVAATLNQTKFQSIVERMIATTNNRIEGDVPKVIEVISNEIGLLENERSSVLRHLIAGGDLTQYGVLNAVTRASQDVEDYDRATELERLGGTVLELSQSQWTKFASVN